MNAEKFTNAFTNLLQDAFALASSYHHSVLLPLHLLGVGLENDYILSCLQQLNVDVGALLNLVEQELTKLPQAYGGQPTLDNHFYRFLNSGFLHQKRHPLKYAQSVSPAPHRFPQGHRGLQYLFLLPGY